MSTLLELLDQKPRLFQKAVRSWKGADKLQSINRPSPAAMEPLVLSLLEALGYNCSPDPSSERSGAGHLVQDPLGRTTFQLRFVHCPHIPVGIRYLQNLVGAMESVRSHNVIFVLTSTRTRNTTGCYTKHATSYMKKSLRYEFLDGATLVDKIYSMT